MSIHKVVTSWIKSVNNDEGKTMIGESFSDAWATLLNAVVGSWGDISVDVLPGENVTFKMVQSQFHGLLDTTTEGSVTLNVPYVSQVATFILVQNISGNEVVSEKTYILENSTSITIDLNPGRKLISINGFARRT